MGLNPVLTFELEIGDRRSYLSRTILTVGAVILVNYDGVLDIYHLDVLENNMINERFASPGPCLDPHPIVCPGKINRLNCHIPYTFFVEFLR